MNAAASELSALRKRISHTCPECGEVFTAITKAIYCSNACRQRAKYKRSTGQSKT